MKTNKNTNSHHQQQANTESTITSISNTSASKTSTLIVSIRTFLCVRVRQVSSAPPSAQQVRTQQASTAADQSATMARLFSAYDVCETSHHLQITHLDLHICDDIHAKDKGNTHLTRTIPRYFYISLCLTCFSVFLLLCAVINKRITGGAMQLSFSTITLDYYPFHRAGMNPAVIPKPPYHEVIATFLLL